MSHWDSEEGRCRAMQIICDIQWHNILCTVSYVSHRITFFWSCKSFSGLCCLLHLAVIIAAGRQQAKTPSSQACEGEAVPSVCKVCVNCNWICIGLLKYYFRGHISLQLDLHNCLSESRRKLVQLSPAKNLGQLLDIVMMKQSKITTSNTWIIFSVIMVQYCIM